jgi:predicted nuclease of predicted toxin-antitoxin system
MQLKEIELWLDMQLSPLLAKWIPKTFSIKATSSYTLLYNTTKDEEIFLRAKEAKNVIIITKDKDFLDIQARLFAPPKIIFLKTGNCSNEKMKKIFSEYLLLALEELINTEAEIVEINSDKNL